MTPLADPAPGKLQQEAPGLGAEHMSQHCPNFAGPFGVSQHKWRHPGLWEVLVAWPWLHVGRIKLFPSGCSGTCSSSGSRAPWGLGRWAEGVPGQREAHFSPLVLHGKNRSQLEKGAKESTGCLSNPLLCLLPTTHPRMPRPGNLESWPRQTLREPVPECWHSQQWLTPRPGDLSTRVCPPNTT